MMEKDKSREKAREEAYMGKPKDPALAAKRRKDWRRVIWRSKQERRAP